MFQDLARIFENGKRAKLLKFFMFQSDVRATAASAGAAIGIPKKAAEREARALLRADLLISRKQPRRKVGVPTEASGKNILYSANPSHPWREAVHAFLDATTLPDDRAILSAFRGVSGLTLIVATGVLARDERSSLDLLIVAKKKKNPKIARGVFKAESLTGLPLRFAVLEPLKYKERLEANDRLLRDVFEFNHRLILGRP
ncbi:hypothetical protein HY090_01630 [Candidatus Kaiserbacteria bacterium]|nr:hypothetical protein [Candidatus Kaiserbacteria bacterium]